MATSGGTVAAMTDHDWRPRYVQLAEQLREEIIRGDLKPGDPLPSEPELAQRSGMSRTSVRNAIRQLREWGLVRAEQGRGTFVRAPRQRIRRHHSERYQWEKERALLPEEERRSTGSTEHDTGLGITGLSFKARYSTTAASPDIAERFDVQPGTEMLLREYWTSAHNEPTPLDLVRSYLVREVAARNPELLDDQNEPWPGGTQHQLRTIGIELDRIIDEITARPPSPEEANTLDIEPGISVLVLWKTSIDTDDRVVEFSEVVLPGDRTEIVYTTKLTRWSQP
jgi:GntR family transcriptional regulator